MRIKTVVHRTVNGRHTHNVFHYSGQTTDGRPVTGKVELPRKRDPLFADPDRQTMVALIDPENLKRPVIVRGDFYPFELAPEEQAAVRAAIAARGGCQESQKPAG